MCCYPGNTQIDCPYLYFMEWVSIKIKQKRKLYMITLSLMKKMIGMNEYQVNKRIIIFQA